jgi:Helix-turn-helix
MDLHGGQDHSEAEASSSPTGPCVQNGHMPATPMSPYRLSLSLLILGWSERKLARRTGEHRTTIRRWLSGESKTDPAVAQWLDVLVAVHTENPGPRRNPPSFLDSQIGARAATNA